MNPESAGTVNGAWMPTAVFETGTGIIREQLQAAFAEENIDARVFFWPLSSLPPFEVLPGNVLAYQIPGRAINLPSYHDITEGELERVVQTLFALYRKLGLIK
jgi:perosamine synthetase